MYWQEQSTQEEFVVPDTVVDMIFAVSCRCLPLDHAYALSTALQQALPWLRHEEDAGVHVIHGAESGNGWYRPEACAGDELIYLSHRTRLELRLPSARVEDAQTLTGKTLDIAGYPLSIGPSRTRLLNPLSTLFSRYVVADAAQDEEGFTKIAARQLENVGIVVRKLLCGKTHRINLPVEELFTRSLMVAELSKRESVLLQQKGLGPARTMGCGLFIPHKDIAPVRKSEDDR